jgi:hypothetical protein
MLCNVSEETMIILVHAALSKTVRFHPVACFSLANKMSCFIFEFMVTIRRRVGEANIALPVCEEMKLLMDYPRKGDVCECAENGQDAVLSCRHNCSYCSTDKSICAAKTTRTDIAALDTTSVSSTTKYNYTHGLEGVLALETTGCDILGNCSACRVTFNDQACNSCQKIQCSDGTPSFEIDCANIDTNSTFSLCDDDSPTTIIGGPMQVLAADGFDICIRNPLEACNAFIQYNYDKASDCECAESESGAFLSCTDPECALTCKSDYSVCWNVSSGYVFDVDGQQISALETAAFNVGRTEVLVLESIGYKACNLAVNGESCNSCERITCPGNYSGTAFDCENIETGASFDDCDYVESGSGLLELESTLA